MRDIVGVKGFYFPQSDLRTLKRDLLFFDKLALFVPSQSDVDVSEETASFFAEIEWLVTNGLLLNRSIESIKQPNSGIGEDYDKTLMFGVAQLCEMIFGLFGSKELRKLVSEKSNRESLFIELRKSGIRNPNFRTVNRLLNQMEDLFRRQIIPQFEEQGFIAPVKKSTNEFEKFIVDSMIASNDFLIRAETIKLERIEGYYAVPVLAGKNSFILDEDDKRADVVQLVLSQIPFPDEDVPWESILEYKQNENSRSKILALRNWISEISRSSHTVPEIEERLEYLIDQYEQQLKLHKLKYTKGSLETLVTAGAEFVESIAHLRFSKLAQFPFKLRNHRLTLMEEELKAPGRELAYIAKLKGQFGRKL